ncbi:MAG TPA: HlyD family efflux transporter periplasmic adaptor subunit [Burkholderiaceae bacterium]|nr:HlyD family efflux transporter periplasmic adaptor subunit [Burkholderiaceae bacterium]
MDHIATPSATRPAAHAGLAMDRVIAGAGRSNRRLRWMAGAVALGALAGLLAWAMPRGTPVPRDELKFSTVVAGTFDDELVVRATVAPAHSVLLDAADGGRVDAVPATDGAIVRAGELLYRLSNPQREQEVLARSADVAQQLANLSVQRAEMAAARATQRRERANLRFALDKAETDLRRTRELAAAGFLSASALEDATRHNTLQARLLAQEIEDGDAEMKTREQSLHDLERAVAGLDDGLRLVRQAAAGLAARAPVAGRLTGFALQVGATVHPGDHLGRIDEEGSFKLNAAIDEFYRDRLRVGLAARVEAAAPGAPRIELSLARIDPQISNGRVGVELAFAGTPPRGLQSGQALDVRIVLGASQPALLLDDGLFYGDSGGTWVYVLDAQADAAERRPVRLGRRAAGRIEVLDGLRAGEQVVVSGVRRYGNAQRLRIHG